MLLQAILAPSKDFATQFGARYLALVLVI